MSRIVADDSAVKREYREFRKLLTLCMDGHTQKEYAEMIGISGAHLNRMINQPVIGRPSVKVLSAMLKALPAGISPYDLFESCGYASNIARLEWRKYRMNQSIAERIVCNVRDLQYMVDEMRKQMRVFARMEDVLNPICTMYGLNYQKLRFYHDLTMENEEGHEGQIGVACRMFWSLPYGPRFIYDICQYVVFYFIEVKDGYLLADVAADGQTLRKYGVLDMDMELSESIRAEEELSQQNMPFVAFGTLHVRPQYVAIQKHLDDCVLDEDGNPIQTPMKTMVWGRGSFLTAMPAHFQSYFLKNSQYFEETEEEQSMTNRMKALKTGAREQEMLRILNGYDYRNASGYLACLLAILSRKAKAKGLTFTIEYGCSEDHTEFLRPCLFVKEAWFLSRNEVDEDALSEIDAFLTTEFLDLAVPSYGTVLVSHTDFVDLRETSFWQGPLSYEYYGWDVYKKDKEKWLEANGLPVEHPHVYDRREDNVQKQSEGE